MKMYEITRSQTLVASVFVEASSKDEAIDIAQGIEDSAWNDQGPDYPDMDYSASITKRDKSIGDFHSLRGYVPAKS